MDLPQVGQPRLAPSKISVPHIFAGVGVSVDAGPVHQSDLFPHRLAEAVSAVGGHCDHRAHDGLPQDRWAPTVSAILAPLAPSGLGCPVVVSRAV